MLQAAAATADPKRPRVSASASASALACPPPALPPKRLREASSSPLVLHDEEGEGGPASTSQHAPQSSDRSLAHLTVSLSEVPRTLLGLVRAAAPDARLHEALLETVYRAGAAAAAEGDARGELVEGVVGSLEENAVGRIPRLACWCVVAMCGDGDAAGAAADGRLVESCCGLVAPRVHEMPAPRTSMFSGCLSMVLERLFKLLPNPRYAEGPRHAITALVRTAGQDVHGVTHVYFMHTCREVDAALSELGPSLFLQAAHASTAMPTTSAARKRSWSNSSSPSLGGGAAARYASVDPNKRYYLSQLCLVLADGLLDRVRQDTDSGTWFADDSQRDLCHVADLCTRCYEEYGVVEALPALARVLCVMRSDLVVGAHSTLLRTLGLRLWNLFSEHELSVMTTSSASSTSSSSTTSTTTNSNHFLIFFMDMLVQVSLAHGCVTMAHDELLSLQHVVEFISHESEGEKRLLPSACLFVLARNAHTPRERDVALRVYQQVRSSLATHNSSAEDVVAAANALVALLSAQSALAGLVPAEDEALFRAAARLLFDDANISPRFAGRFAERLAGLAASSSSSS